jgi:DoxX-like protein
MSICALLVRRGDGGTFFCPAHELEELTLMRRTGLILSWLVTLFCLFDGGARLAGFAPYVEGLSKVGFDPGLAPWIGLSLLVSTILYAIPRTMVVGAILLTGYLGGAVATQVRLGDPWFLFPAGTGALAWAGLWCRSQRTRDLLPLAR